MGDLRARICRSATFVAAAMLPVSLSCSCASGPPLPPTVRALHAVEHQVDDGIREGFEESEDQDSYQVTARFNPARCDAPNFELRVHAHWTRAYLDAPSAPAQAAIETFKQRAPGQNRFQFLQLTGNFSGNRKSRQGIAYAVFDVTAVTLPTAMSQRRTPARGSSTSVP